jgi:hypothetical protein
VCIAAALFFGCANPLASTGAAATSSAAAKPPVAMPVTFVFTSDVHFGITRGSFRGEGNVASRVVDAALVAKINRLPAAVLPNDGGLRAGEPVGPIAFAVITGDIANRQELYPIHIQSASVSWAQFEETIWQKFALKNSAGEPAPLLLVPGNHDVADAIGAPTKMVPATDATSMAEMYNRMLHPAVPLTKDTYDYATNKIYYSRDFGGAHCVFLTMWPGSDARAWIENDLKAVPATTPVFLFCHDPPDIDARHLTNPHGNHSINERDKYENMVSEVYAGGAANTEKKKKAKDDSRPDGDTSIEQRQLADFLRRHPNITGFFHGHNNWHEFYVWRGPDGDLALNTFRADSPMKGRESGKDEKRLSFQLITFDTATQTLTSRECRWNAQGKADTDETPVGWGESHTVSIAPRAN